MKGGILGNEAKYYTTKGLALLCGVSTRTVDRWKKSGLVFKRGLITLEEFEAWRAGEKASKEPLGNYFGAPEKELEENQSKPAGVFFSV